MSEATLAACAVVLLGGYCGGTARHLVSGMVARWVGETFPWGTLVVNVSGGVLIGGFAGIAHAGGPGGNDLVHDFIVIGFLGGYTTVSSFSLQTLTLALNGEGWRAALNIILSAGLCVLAVAGGFWIGKAA